MRNSTRPRGYQPDTGRVVALANRG